MRLLIIFVFLVLSFGSSGFSAAQTVMTTTQTTVNTHSAQPESKRHSGRSGHDQQFCWNFAGLPLPLSSEPHSSEISTSQIEALLPSYAGLEQSYLPSEGVAPQSFLDEEMFDRLAEEMLSEQDRRELETKSKNRIERWTRLYGPPEDEKEGLERDRRRKRLESKDLRDRIYASDNGRAAVQYLANRSAFKMTAPLMRGQLLAELAKRKFDEGDYSSALDLADRALKALESANPAFVVTPYQITIDDTRGHREPEFAVSLAFLVRQLSDFVLAESAQDPMLAYTAAHSLISQWLVVGSLYAHLVSDQAYANNPSQEPHRFDQVGWEAGSEVMNRLLSHFASNALVAHDTRSPEKYWKALEGHAANAIFFHRGALYADFQTDSPGESLSLRIDGAGSGTVPPIGRFGFVDNQRPHRLRLIAGLAMRDDYLRWLRAEVNRVSTEDVPFFAAVVERDGFRLVLAPALLENAPDDLLGEYDTFYVPESDTNNFASQDSLSAGGRYLREVMAALGSRMFTLYTAALHRVPGERQTKIDDMVFHLSEAFPTNVLRDIYTPETLPRAEAAQTRLFGGPKDFVLLTASDDVALKDFGIVNRLRESHIEPLKRQGMAEITYTGQNASAIADTIGGQDRRILLVTAHSDAELERMLHDLGKAGAFRNNTVFAYTCRTETSREMTEFIGGSGGNGTWIFDRKLLVDDATVLLERTLQAIGDSKQTGALMREIVPTLIKGYVPVFSISDLKLPIVETLTARAG